MDERCQKCLFVCKKLDAEEEPSHYLFTDLKPPQVTAIIEAVVKEHQGKLLQVKESCLSCGNQLAVLLEPTNAPVTDDAFDQCLLFISQAATISDQVTELWIRYGTPAALCDQPAVVAELSALLERILLRLNQADRGLSSNCRSHAAT